MTQISIRIKKGFENEVSEFCKKNNMSFSETIISGDYEVMGNADKVENFKEKFANAIEVTVDANPEEVREEMIDRLTELNRKSLKKHLYSMKHYNEKNWRDSFKTYSNKSLREDIARYEWAEEKDL